MNDRTFASAAATAIGLLSVGTIVLLWTAEHAPRPSPFGGASPPAAGGDVAGPPAGPIPHAGGSAAPVALTAHAPFPVDDDPAWRESRVASRVGELGAVAPYVLAGLRDARARMGFCFRDARARAGAAPPGAGAARDPAVLVLYLAAREGVIDVVDVRVDRAGGVAPEVVECCRGVLRGTELRAPNAAAGGRWRLAHLLE